MAFPFWNTAVYNLFSRFSKDVATRRAASLSASTPFPSGFYHDAARRVATVFEKWNCKIETCLPARRRKALYKRLTPYGPFAVVPLLEYGG